MLSPLELEKLAVQLVAVGSVNGTSGETAVVEFLEERLRESHAARHGAIKVHLVHPPDDPAGCPLLVAHRPGRGRRAVLLMGHVDTVGVDDYLDLTDLALRPRELTERIARGALGQAMAALAQSGEWLFGRGILDMKSGLAAGLAAFLSMAESEPDGHIFFAATPDEEGGSRGAHALLAWLAKQLPDEGVTLDAVINMDYTTSRPQDGGAFHAYAGSTGKLLPAVYVQGIPSHAAEPEHGLDPNAVLAAITSQVAYSGTLRDGFDDEASPPPVTLFQRDSKPCYDVQTSLSAAAYYSLFHRKRTPAQQMDRFVKQVRRGVKLFAKRTNKFSLPPVRVVSFAELRQISPERTSMNLPAPDIPEASRRIVASLAGKAFPDEPLVVCYFAGPLIPCVESPTWARKALEVAVRACGAPYRLHRYYPYISDLSFLAPSKDWQDPTFALNYPLMGSDREGAQHLWAAPLVVGPYGFGAHQRNERVLRSHAFSILPRVLQRTVLELLHP